MLAKYLAVALVSLISAIHANNLDVNLKTLKKDLQGRGQKLQYFVDQSGELTNQAAQFSDMAAKLKEKYTKNTYSNLFSWLNQNTRVAPSEEDSAKTTISDASCNSTVALDIKVEELPHDDQTFKNFENWMKNFSRYSIHPKKDKINKGLSDQAATVYHLYQLMRASPKQLDVFKNYAQVFEDYKRQLESEIETTRAHSSEKMEQSAPRSSIMSFFQSKTWPEKQIKEGKDRVLETKVEALSAIIDCIRGQ